MIRKTLFAIALALPLACGVAKADSLALSSSTIEDWSAGSPLSFDFTGDANWPLLNSNHILTEIELVATFTPGASQSKTYILNGKMEVEGIDTFGMTTSVQPGLNISAFVTPATPAFPDTIATPDNDNSSGLSFSDLVVNALLTNGGILNGTLFADLQTDWTAFFAAGGTVDLMLNTLYIEGTPSETPEPASLLLWGGVAGVGLAVRRWRNKKTPATV